MHDLVGTQESDPIHLASISIMDANHEMNANKYAAQTWPRAREIASISHDRFLWLRSRRRPCGLRTAANVALWIDVDNAYTCGDTYL